MLIEATVTFLTTAEGGRSSPPANGYRPPVWFGQRSDDGLRIMWDFAFTFVGLEADAPVTPGHEVVALMRASCATVDDLPSEGDHRFEVREGDRLVARGRVRAVVPQ